MLGPKNRKKKPNAAVNEPVQERKANIRKSCCCEWQIAQEIKISGLVGPRRGDF